MNICDTDSRRVEFSYYPSGKVRATRELWHALGRVVRAVQFEYDQNSQCTRCARYSFYTDGTVREKKDRLYRRGQHLSTIITRYDEAGERTMTETHDYHEDGSVTTFKDLWRGEDFAPLLPAP